MIMKYTSTNRQVRNWKGVMHLFQNRKTMWMMVRETFRGHYKMSLITMMVLLFGLLYIIFPFDVITDFIPVLGWIDDAAVFYLVLRRVHKETQRYIRFKAMERRSGY